MENIPYPFELDREQYDNSGNLILTRLYQDDFIGPTVPRYTLWEDKHGVKARVIYADLVSVQVNRDIQFRFPSAKKGSQAWGEFDLKFFLAIFRQIN